MVWWRHESFFKMHIARLASSVTPRLAHEHMQLGGFEVNGERMKRERPATFWMANTLSRQPIILRQTLCAFKMPHF